MLSIRTTQLIVRPACTALIQQSNVATSVCFISSKSAAASKTTGKGKSKGNEKKPATKADELLKQDKTKRESPKSPFKASQFASFPQTITALKGLKEQPPTTETSKETFAKCEHVLGFVPNVLKAYTHNPAQLDCFLRYYNELMLGESPLSKLEREMIAVVVSSTNHCFYCVTAHGATVRALSNDPTLGDMLTTNYRAAKLSDKHRTMLDFAYKLTAEPHNIVEEDRAALKKVGFDGEGYAQYKDAHTITDRAIFDITQVVGFFNMSNRLAAGIELTPNIEYHFMARTPKDPKEKK